MRFALRANEIRSSVRVRLPLRDNEIEGLSPFSDYPRQTPICRAVEPLKLLCILRSYLKHGNRGHACGRSGIQPGLGVLKNNTL